MLESDLSCMLAERLQYVNFLPTLKNALSYLHVRLESASESVYAILSRPWKPFSGKLWLFVLAVVLSFCLAHFVVHALETRKRVFKFKALSVLGQSNWAVLANELYLTVAGTMGGQYHEPTSVASRFIAVGFHLFVIITVSACTLSLTSPRMPVPLASD
jgi:hypothetical protein